MTVHLSPAVDFRVLVSRHPWKRCSTSKMTPLSRRRSLGVQVPEASVSTSRTVTLPGDQARTYSSSKCLGSPAPSRPLLPTPGTRRRLLSRPSSSACRTDFLYDVLFVKAARMASVVSPEATTILKLLYVMYMHFSYIKLT